METAQFCVAFKDTIVNATWKKNKRESINDCRYHLAYYVFYNGSEINFLKLTSQ